MLIFKQKIFYLANLLFFARLPKKNRAFLLTISTIGARNLKISILFNIFVLSLPICSCDHKATDRDYQALKAEIYNRKN